MPTDPEDVGDGLYRVFNDADEELYFDADGNLVGAWTPDGDEIETGDPGRFGFDPDAESALVLLQPTDDDRLAELHDRIDALEQAPPMPVAQLEVTPAAPDPDDMVASWDDELTTIESGWGRPSLMTERRRLAEVAQTRGCSLLDADTWLGYNDPTWNPPSLDNDHERQAYMGQRIADAERFDRSQRFGDDDLSSELEPDRQGFYNIDNDSERQLGMARRLMGFDVELAHHEPEEQQ